MPEQDQQAMLAVISEDIKLRKERLSFDMQEMHAKKEYALQALEYQNQQMTEQRKFNEKLNIRKAGFWIAILIVTLVFVWLMASEGHEETLRWLIGDLLKFAAGVAAGSGGTFMYFQFRK